MIIVVESTSIIINLSVLYCAWISIGLESDRSNFNPMVSFYLSVTLDNVLSLCDTWIIISISKFK